MSKPAIFAIYRGGELVQLAHEFLKVWLAFAEQLVSLTSDGNDVNDIRKELKQVQETFRETNRIAIECDLSRTRARTPLDKAREGSPSQDQLLASEDQEDPNPRKEPRRGVELYKGLRVSINAPCKVILPLALKRFNITDDWRQYALYIVHGDQERCLGLEEKPVLLFKELEKEERKPMFMLRRHAPPQNGWSGAAKGNSAKCGGEECALPAPTCRVPRKFKSSDWRYFT